MKKKKKQFFPNTLVNSIFFFWFLSSSSLPPPVEKKSNSHSNSIESNIFFFYKNLSIIISYISSHVFRFIEVARIEHEILLSFISSSSSSLIISRRMAKIKFTFCWNEDVILISIQFDYFIDVLKTKFKKVCMTNHTAYTRTHTQPTWNFFFDVLGILDIFYAYINILVFNHNIITRISWSNYY